MGIILSTLKKVLFWSYERGSWQYDVLCVLILLFLFFAPNRLFRDPDRPAASRPVPGPVFLSLEELGHFEPAELDQRAAEHLARKLGHKVSVLRIEPMLDNAGNLKGYLAQIK